MLTTVDISAGRSAYLASRQLHRQASLPSVLSSRRVRQASLPLVTSFCSVRQVGLPAKSGVSGGMMLVVPNVMGICLWSPPLDMYGNSVRGIQFCSVSNRSISDVPS